MTPKGAAARSSPARRTRAGRRACATARSNRTPAACSSRSTTTRDGRVGLMETIAALRERLARGETSSEALVRAALARIEDRSGEGAATFTRVYAARALDAARKADALRRRGAAPLSLCGIPVSVKDLFDVAGEPTLAGSVVLRGAAPAARDADAVARLRSAGAIVIGKTNMTEFAFSGLGLNPHYGTPRSPWDRVTGRIPGGSSSGAAVSVSDGMAAVGIGTDTGGSVRIPAAYCGLVGFKPTARRVSREGVVPLSATLDSVGPIARTVACRAPDAARAAAAARRTAPRPRARSTRRCEQSARPSRQPS